MGKRKCSKRKRKRGMYDAEVKIPQNAQRWYFFHLYQRHAGRQKIEYYYGAYNVRGK